MRIEKGNLIYPSSHPLLEPLMKGQTSIFLTLSFLNIKIFNMGMTDEEHLFLKKKIFGDLFFWLKRAKSLGKMS